MIGRRRGGMAALAMAILSAGCAIRPASPSPAPDGSTGDHATLSVVLTGAVDCQAFPYSCRATLSVVPAGTPRDPAWRGLATDPWWAPPAGFGGNVAPFDPAPLGGPIPEVAPGAWDIVVLLLASSDAVSFGPDGRQLEGLITSCADGIAVTDETREIPVHIAFERQDGFRAITCTVRAG